MWYEREGRLRLRAQVIDLMKQIALIAILGIVIVDIAFQMATGAVPQARVAGTILITLAFLAAAIAVGTHEAMVNGRGAGGYVVSIALAVLGAFVAASLSGIVLEPILRLMSLEGSNDPRPWSFVASAGMMLFVLIGARFGLSKGKRWR